MGISFEYVCKSLLISNDYKINENGNEPTKKSEKEVKFNPTKTFGIEIIWNFIQKEKFISFSNEEEIIGNYLCFLRNVHAHIPLSPASRGDYNQRAIKLIRKILTETKKQHLKILGEQKWDLQQDMTL